MDEILHTLQKLFSYAYINSYQSLKKSLYSISTLSEKWWYFLLTNISETTQDTITVLINITAYIMSDYKCILIEAGCL